MNDDIIDIEYQREDGTVLSAALSVRWRWEDDGIAWAAGERSGVTEEWRVYIDSIEILEATDGEQPISDADLPALAVADYELLLSALDPWVEGIEMDGPEEHP